MFTGAIRTGALSVIVILFYSTSSPIHTVCLLFSVSVSDSFPCGLSCVFPCLSAAMSIHPRIDVRSYYWLIVASYLLSSSCA